MHSCPYGPYGILPILSTNHRSCRLLSPLRARSKATRSGKRQPSAHTNCSPGHVAGLSLVTVMNATPPMAHVLLWATICLQEAVKTYPDKFWEFREMNLEAILTLRQPKFESNSAQMAARRAFYNGQELGTFCRNLRVANNSGVAKLKTKHNFVCLERPTSPNMPLE